MQIFVHQYLTSSLGLHLFSNFSDIYSKNDIIIFPEHELMIPSCARPVKAILASSCEFSVEFHSRSQQQVCFSCCLLDGAINERGAHWHNCTMGQFIGRAPRFHHILWWGRARRRKQRGASHGGFVHGEEVLSMWPFGGWLLALFPLQLDQLDEVLQRFIGVPSRRFQLTSCLTSWGRLSLFMCVDPVKSMLFPPLF